jgi:iron complex outermembrane receptor protein
VRTPSRVEEDFTAAGIITASPPTFLRLFGDGKFSSEGLIGYEAGYRALLTSKLYLDLATFYNDYNHLLSAEPGTPFSETTPPPTHTVVPIFLRNGVLGQTTGVELAPDWRPTRWWRLQGSYSFLHMDLQKARNSMDSSTPTTTEGSSPHHQVVVQSSLALLKNLEFDQTYRYVSALPAQQVKAYSTMDTQMTWRFARLELAVVGQNLLQPTHAEFAGDPGPLVGIKRGIYGKIAWRSAR